MVWELCGYVASGLVLAAFSMKDMTALRVAALASNLAFMAYGLALDLTPIWLLHALLVPINGYRLVEAMRRPASSASPRSRPTAGDDPGFGGSAASICDDGLGARRAPTRACFVASYSVLRMR